MSNGNLTLSKRPAQTQSSCVNIFDFSKFIPEENNQSFTFSIYEDNVLLVILLLLLTLFFS